MWKYFLILLAFNQGYGSPARNIYDYKEAIKLSLLFYEAQRSGKLPTNNRIHWRGHSALNDKGENGEDLSGGYYDAADFVKFGFTISYTISILSWGVINYENTYRKIGQYETIIDAIKWGTDYILKCHTSPSEFYAQVGDFPMDHKYWGRPEELNMTRPAFKISKSKPGSDVAAEASAALSSASIVFRKENFTYADILTQHAMQLFDLANNYKGLYLESYPSLNHYYENSDYRDELVWAAIWLFKATKLTEYAKLSQKLYKTYDIMYHPRTFFYNNKSPGIQILLAQEFQNIEYVQSVQNFCNLTINNGLITPKGLLYMDKSGTLSKASNVGWICLQFEDLFDETNDHYLQFARNQVGYILGSTGFSYLVGFGKEYPQQPHHAASSCKDLPAPCSWDDFRSSKPNPQVLYGALVSGPDYRDDYIDVRDEYIYSEVTIDFNAGFQSLLAALLSHEFDSIEY